MFEFISVILVELFGVILVEWFFGGILKGLRWIGYRIFSLFTGEQGIPVSILRKKHDASIWPWMIIFLLLLGIVALGFSLA